MIWLLSPPIAAEWKQSERPAISLITPAPCGSRVQLQLSHTRCSQLTATMKSKHSPEEEGLLNGMVLEYLLHQLTELRLKQASLALSEAHTLEEETSTYNKIVEILNSSEKLVTVIRGKPFQHHLSPVPYLTKCLNMAFGRGDEELRVERTPPDATEGERERPAAGGFLCRLHRDSQCKRCVGEASYFSKRSGLLQSIPLFLKVSQLIYEQVLRESEEEEISVLSTWYDLFLEFQTQAVIESWICDKRNLGFVLESVFKYRTNPNSMLWRESKQLSIYFEECQERKQEELVDYLDSTYPLKAFEVNLVNFLEVISCRFEKPILLKYKEMATVDDSIRELLHFVAV
ncbi:hypothetical protein K493DRAFT_296839 [Basidiobolus meristosporus CBS 931.73]|uniref:Uncharacterized protein n=1 Tax=Basidiobolus meristosporus CBS 931.73 TaxID=1314790 RepID=A0A1Y1Z4F4_9FUNG|nr:hypothetical protein K493DRAFT_296839 [Basidiobolus meristosporus CBS 931.73]|eukprot:ORY04715.1 hypothetical protein K493DRAFT_296839 [Basidiobolus meristosporus CBS 931.73]